MQKVADAVRLLWVTKVDLVHREGWARDSPAGDAAEPGQSVFVNERMLQCNIEQAVLSAIIFRRD